MATYATPYGFMAQWFLTRGGSQKISRGAQAVTRPTTRNV